MSIAVETAIFFAAFLGVTCLFYRIILFKEYAAYKASSRKEKRAHNWILFFLNHQFNPNFSRKYGKTSMGKKVLIAILSVSSLALFAQYVL